MAYIGSSGIVIIVKKKADLSRIASNPKILHGKPCIKDTRIPVYLILQMLAGGQTKKYILKEYPQLKEEDINAAIEYGALLATEEVNLQLT